ncbi:MAG TPA: hypothetical protein VMU70_02455 [Candidatus Tyrphobacter sp.]|nr:hypothetical protein [Candidatus Tyrphobacter sp.]
MDKDEIRFDKENNSSIIARDKGPAGLPGPIVGRLVVNDGREVSICVHENYKTMENAIKEGLRTKAEEFGMLR